MEKVIDAKVGVVEADKIGSATSALKLPRTLAVVAGTETPRAGDVVVVRALPDSATYNQLELPSGRLAKVIPGDTLVGVLGSRRALKGFVGDIPSAARAGDQLHLLNMGGVIGQCTGHHSSLSDAIRVEVLGLACDEAGRVLNISDAALQPAQSLPATVPPRNCQASRVCATRCTWPTTAPLRQRVLSTAACLRPSASATSRPAPKQSSRSWWRAHRT